MIGSVSGASADSTITISGISYRLIVWTGSGSLEVTDSNIVAQIAVIGGGGGGGSYGGGGAGGVVVAENKSLSPDTYTITVGAGGASNTGSSPRDGSNGEDSVAFGFTAKGGGGGQFYGGSPGKAGGSGGGAGGSGGAFVTGGASNQDSFTGATSYGNSGGGTGGRNPSHGGGGGGAGGSGQSFSSGYAGDGGAGIDLSGIFGSSVGDSGWFASGGGGGGLSGFTIPGSASNGGGSSGSATNAQDATAGTGGGGGGAGFSGTPQNGGDGGSGVVLLLVPIVESSESPAVKIANIPPVEVNAEIVLPSGDRIRWDAADPNVGNRPLAPAFETESGRGFSSGSVVLRRPTDRDYPELGLLNELILRSATGTVVYQGRAQGIPVGEEFSLDCDGWWSYAEQREITDLIVDRDASAWGSVTKLREQVGTNFSGWLYDKHYSTETDRGAIVITGTTGSIPANSTAEIAYRAPAGTRIGSFGYKGTQNNTSNVTTATVIGAAEDMLSSTSSVNLTLNNTDQTATFTTRPQTLVLGARASVAHSVSTTATLFTRRITPAVYGETSVSFLDRNDGLTGFTASDGIRYIANKWLPKLDTSGVQESGYPIAQGVWRDPTTPGDAIRQMNSFHLWRLGIWEDRRLTFAPYDLSVADWQVAAGVDGVRVEYQGDTTENVYNGIAVSFTELLTGESRRLTPDDTEDLRDTGDWIAANQWGDEVWLNIDVSWPCSEDDAVEIGRIALANANQARRPSTITVPAYIKDMNGTYWPSSYVRADQTILVTNQHTPTPRLITRTSWSDHSLTITTDDAIDTMEALNQRISGALAAGGLG